MKAGIQGARMVCHLAKYRQRSALVQGVSLLGRGVVGAMRQTIALPALADTTSKADVRVLVPRCQMPLDGKGRHTATAQGRCAAFAGPRSGRPARRPGATACGPTVCV